MIPFCTTLEIVNPPAYEITVNSPFDGEIQADNRVTLREAIALSNGTITINELTQEEQKNVQPIPQSEPTENRIGSRIEFNLPPDQTTIYLQDALPPILTDGTIIDGTTQRGYQRDEIATNKTNLIQGLDRQKIGAVSTPIVAISVRKSESIPYGLRVTGDRVLIRGLSLYGFNQEQNAIAQPPPANIIIGCQPPLSSHSRRTQRELSSPPQPPNSGETQRELSSPSQPTNFGETQRELSSPSQPTNFGETQRELSSPPQPPNSGGSVIIQNNWLGISPRQEKPKMTSAFGIVIWNGTQGKIIHNHISHNDSSGILTSINADYLFVQNNIISNNGLRGMADGIRLEGKVDQTRIRDNYIHSNGGSGIYLFKPEGAVGILNNRITNNAQKIDQAAIYLMGNNHRIVDNRISQENGSGIVVGGYPQKDFPGDDSASGNIIARNRFGNMGGMSIDLITRNHTGVRAFNLGDGVNPPRRSLQRRNDTGNAAVQTPEFISSEFFRLNGVVEIKGKADPKVVIELYRVDGEGELSVPLGMVETNETGEFVFRSQSLYPGQQLSAVAVDLTYGTSEPATAAIIQSLERGGKGE